MNSRFYGITISDWILIIVFCILFLASLYIISLVFFNIRKAGSFKLRIKELKYKNQIFILGAILFILIFNCIQFIKNPGMASLIATSMLLIMFSANVVLLYFGIGIYENGIMYSGVLHTWKNVKNFRLSNNLLVLNIENRKNSKEFQYSFYINNISVNEVEKFLNSKIIE